MILLSAHKDVVKYPFKFESKYGMHKGLLDNFIGVLLGYLTVYGNESLTRMFRCGEIQFSHSNNEEFGIDDLPKIDDDDIVVVIDVAAGERYHGRDFVIDTWHGFTPEQTENIIDDMAWEGFNFTATPLNEVNDESDTWKEKGVRVISFAIPISAPDDNWHGEEAIITADALMKSVRALQRLICYLHIYAVQKRSTTPSVSCERGSRRDIFQNSEGIRPSIEREKVTGEEKIKFTGFSILHRSDTQCKNPLCPNCYW